MPEPEFFTPEQVKVAQRSLLCSKRRHDSCQDWDCECDCHQYMIWDTQLERWLYA
jgi:hypothetical protein